MKLGYSKIITVGEDSIMNVKSTSNGDVVEKIDLENEIYAIASNSIDKIAIGGEQNKLDIITIQNG